MKAVITLLLLLTLATAGVLAWQVKVGNDRYQELNSQFVVLASSTESLSRSIALIDNELSITRSESSAITASLASQLAAEQANVQSQLQSIGSTVGTLDKLSRLDPELLKKYSKVAFLNENYAPANLTDIDKSYLYRESKPEKVESEIYGSLKRMMDDAAAANIKLYVLSAYRSYYDQASLKGKYTVTYGAGTANSFSADQGYSEHQLGTTIDFTTTGLGGGLDGFDKTAAYKWLTENAYKYGFVLSYPKNNTYYVFEPWHWRFVGFALALRLHNEGKYFYDFDQRVIDTYLINIFDTAL